MSLLPVSAALARVLDGVVPLASEPIAIADAHGRTLAEDLQATLTQPPFNASAMDGYAVRSTDIAALPVTLKVVGTAQAGRGAGRTLGTGEAIRIFTGAPIPDGSDAVVIQENCTANSDGTVTVTETSTSGSNIRPRGQDFHNGDVVIAAGEKLSARTLTLAAAAGHGALNVHRRPVVAILATGDELVPPGTAPGPDQIVSSNPFGVAALVASAGAVPLLLGIARDDPLHLDLKLSEAIGADILVTIGGASVGDHDLVKPALEARGATLAFAKIAMRPGKPTLFGRMGETRVLGLPGNPVSCLISARVFLVPLILALVGRADAAKPHTATLGESLPANGPRTHYMRALLDDGAMPPRVAPLPSQDSALLTTLARANALIIQPADGPAVPAGAPVEILRLDF